MSDPASDANSTCLIHYGKCYAKQGFVFQPIDSPDVIHDLNWLLTFNNLSQVP